MRGDRVEIVVDTGDGARTYEVTATRAGRRVEVSTVRGVVEVNEITRTGTVVRTARFMASRVIALVEHPADTSAAGLPGAAAAPPPGPAGWLRQRYGYRRLVAATIASEPAGRGTDGQVDYHARVDLLEPVIQPYAWGSHTAIAELQGRSAPTTAPEAELWMGAHPSAPSGLRRDGGRTTLDKVIAADPPRELGAARSARFGGRLPFLLKVLAADRALSIQVHPSREQAEAGYREETARGLAPGDKSRNYVDDWPKPEILCALTRFEVLAGMRTTADAAALLRALRVRELDPLAADLAAAAGRSGRGGQGGEDTALTGALGAILTWPDEGRAALIGAVTAGCERIAAAGGEYAGAAAATVRIAGDHPGDLGIVASLLLRYLVLRPGEAVFLPAGGPHSYLHGTGVELLANSDNVVRAGLTPKHIDVPELLRLVDPAAAVPVIEPRPDGAGVLAYDSPGPEFRLYRAEPGAAEVTLPGRGGPRIVLCTEGAGLLRAGSGPLRLARGESCYLSAAEETVTASGPASLFVAASGG